MRLHFFSLAKFLPLVVVLAACTPTPTTFSVTSDAYADGDRIPQVYTCDGDAKRPPLTITGVPAAAVSLAIIMEDIDASGGIFTHWTAWNIDPRTTTIASDDQLVGAVEGVNGADSFGYIGPCPPDGTHRYVTRVFAVSRHFALPSTITSDYLKLDLADYVLAQTELTGVYGRTSDAPSGTGALTLPGSTIVE